MFKTIKKADISLVLVAILGMGLSLTAFYYVKQWESLQVMEDYKKQADNHVRVLRETFTNLGNILYSINGLYHVNNNITRDEFSQFVKRILALQPAIQSLEWLPYIPATQRSEVESKVRAEGFGQFQFWEFSQTKNRQAVRPREVYYPVLFTEPLTNNLESLGYDLASQEIFRKALEIAQTTKQLTISEATWLSLNQSSTLGFRILVPVYKEDNPSAIPLKPVPAKLIGLVAAVISFDNLLHSTLRIPKLKTAVFVQIFDDTPNTLIKQLYSPAWYDEFTQNQAQKLADAPLEIGGRQWRVVLKEIDHGWFKLLPWYAWEVLGIGLLFTLVLWRYLHLTLTRARWAEDLVTMRTQSLSEANEALNHAIQKREQITKDLEASRQRFQAIFDEAAIGIAQVDLNYRIIDSNRLLQNLLRYREDELKDKLLQEFAHPADAELDLPMLQKMLEGKYDTYRIRKRYICKNGVIIWTNQSCSIVRDTDNPFIISMIEDITERKLAEEARLKAEKRYREIFENAIEGIFQCTPAGQFISVNPAFVRMFGYDSAEQLCTEITDLGKQLYVEASRRVEFMQLLESDFEVQGFEYQARCRDNSIIWVNETSRLVRDNNGATNYYEGIIEDVTSRKMIEDKLRYDASHDQLTGLLNRSAFTTRLSAALQQLHSLTSNQSVLAAVDPIQFAVLFVDLDRFKIVNDSLGHLVGDKLLTEIASRLNIYCKNDIVARFGGDEFALMLEHLIDLTALEQRLHSIQLSLSEPYLVKNQWFKTTASIGIALASPTYTSADEILRDADTAMYEAKKHGRGKWMIFQPGMHTQVVNLLRMESDLRKALDREEFSVFYQPIVSLENFNTVGVEALLRWHHPEYGLIRPDLFIPLAEETGLITELGLWVFETACAQLRYWQTKFLHHAELGMNINVSPIQLRQQRLVNRVQDIIEKTGIKPTTCRIEITESAMMQDPEAALNVLNDLKHLQVLLYVDDFGTGYSSLSYLQKFPIDALKIDKSFISGLEQSGKSAQIVEAIIALGKAFDLRIVAEGVETEYQLSLLTAAHCHHVQGYIFSRPYDSKTIEKFLSTAIAGRAKQAN